MILNKYFKNFAIFRHGNKFQINHFSFQSKVKNQEKSPRNYEPVIGLEVHAQIMSESKLFSSASTQFLSRPNSQATFFDVSLPGTLPVLNRCCVEKAIKTGLALNCQIAQRSTFDRKHYFYGDMPNGYQITQQSNPIAHDGYIEFIVYEDFYGNDRTFQPYLKRCRLKQIQMEQDSGKSLIDNEMNVNLIDLNRAGVPLMEFVFEPDLISPLEAVSLIRELIAILKSIQVCSCKMEEGALRVDANISIRPVGSNKLGTRTEIKNLNSFRFLREAIQYEIKRQCLVLEQKGNITNETLGYDVKTKRTFVMRDKEVVQDYRFMPEPNLPPILLKERPLKSDKNYGQELISIEPIRKSLPELPGQIRQTLLSSQYALSLREVYFLLNEETWLELFFEIYQSSKRKNSKECFEFIMIYLKQIYEDKIDPLTAIKLTPLDPKVSLATIKDFISQDYLAELCDMLFGEEISQNTTYDLLKLYLQHDQRNPRKIVEQFNWWLIKDMDRIEKVCHQVIESLPKISKKYAKTGIKKPRSMLIQKALVLLNNQVNEKLLWDVYDKILRNNKT